ncbi:hypothetical protein KIPB_009524, partial [Kipferlia bialata]|eukprot:g9524.t1
MYQTQGVQPYPSAPQAVYAQGGVTGVYVQGDVTGVPAEAA